MVFATPGSTSNTPHHKGKLPARIQSHAMTIDHYIEAAMRANTRRHQPSR